AGAGAGGGSSGGSTYTVKSGDTLSHIAAANGVSVNSLINWNSLSSHIFYPGQKIAVSKNGSSGSSGSSGSNSSGGSRSGASGGSTDTVEGGAALCQIAAANGLSVNSWMNWNNVSSQIIYPGQKIAGSKHGSSGSSGSSGCSSSGPSSSGSSGGSTYTGYSGDTLSHIAAANG